MGGADLASDLQAGGDAFAVEGDARASRRRPGATCAGPEPSRAGRGARAVGWRLPAIDPADQALLAAARSAYDARRARDGVFGDMREAFRDPAWDIVLDLFAAHLEGRRVAAGDAVVASCVPATTALRCLRGMADLGVLVRHGDQRDRRRQLVTLTKPAIGAMRALLASDGYGSGPASAAAGSGERPGRGDLRGSDVPGLRLDRRT